MAGVSESLTNTTTIRDPCYDARNDGHQRRRFDGGGRDCYAFASRLARERGMYSDPTTGCWLGTRTAMERGRARTTAPWIWFVL